MYCSAALIQASRYSLHNFVESKLDIIIVHDTTILIMIPQN